ncbi:conidial yellow pigment biosynthesis polyketide synthase [Xylona heveae TC161]|uniref:Conidial yellow pigment biosynthesis polyketide synthase n=1 Tax=Xylona heveae (strain CBS 132557 / TC161) TaxID=1328760 RepID=A0A165K4C6_XYLHT|nr:conidial yellow pigment biosynthesis polyketide synthase [Xylona heveae TC161]KZF26968.1 conidial yellow pigment biosynthesis polyketide synthase [Xylona heveae TC161]
MDLLVFGDQEVDIHAFLQKIWLAGKQNTLLGTFLERTGLALREEIARLPGLERQKIPNFTNIHELAKRYHEAGQRHASVETALSCVAQLAQFIGYAEHEAGDALSAKGKSALGSGTGLLSAAVISSSASLTGLIPLAVEVVILALRIGLQVETFADRLCPTSSGEPWSYKVSGISLSQAEKILDEFHNDNGVPASNYAYISTVNLRDFVISGPPTTLRRLFDRLSSIQEMEKHQLPVYGPFHAPHLHQHVDKENLLEGYGRNFSHLLDTYHPRIPIISSCTGSYMKGSTLRDVLLEIVDELLEEKLRLDKVAQACVETINDTRSAECRVLQFGDPHTAEEIVGALRKDAKARISSDDGKAWMNTEGHPKKSNDGISGKIAIVGMAGRFPGGADHEEFWKSLEKGLDLHREVPKDRFDAQTHCDPNGKVKNTSHTPFGCFIEDPGLFDPRFFNMSPREAFQTDPMQRLALVTAYEALEMAGYVPNRTPSTKLDRIGTFYGQTSDDWREIQAAQDIDTYFITGGVRAFGPGRIHYHFKFSGPSFNVDTACSSSMAAIQLACTSLCAQECDTAVAGGVNVLTNPDIFAGLSRGQFLSKTGPCQTFDNDADGYCRADGVGTVILKRLEDAEADKDNILAVIVGTATNHSANAISITHPHAETQEILYRHIMDQAGVSPLDVDYVEMHGTGTQAGDGTEMRSVTNVFAPSSPRRNHSQPLYLGAVKANAGHGEAASGVTALIKCLMMMQKNSIPPHVGVKKSMNTTFPKDLKERNVRIAFEKTPLVPKHGSKRRIFVNNFSAAGGNTAVLLEDGPSHAPPSHDPRSTHVIAVSAKSKSSLRSNMQRLISYLDNHPNASLPDLSYTTTARRIQHNYRVAFAINDLEAAKAVLKAGVDETVNPVSSKPPKVGFVFTGQGSHYQGLGKELYETSTQFRADLTNFDSIATLQGYPSFIPLVDGSVADVKDISPISVQIGMVCVEMALTRLWASWGIRPDVVLGHSLGEYAALNAAGVLSDSDTIFLVGERARLLTEMCTSGTHAMLAIKGSAAMVSESFSIAGSIEIACMNGPDETVLSGPTNEINAMAERISARGMKCTKLNVPFAFHSSQVDPILDPFEAASKFASFGEATVPVISPLLGKPVTKNDVFGPKYLRKHARECVNFLDALRSGQTAEIFDEKTVWVEVGPHPVCSNMVRSSLGQATKTVPSFRRGDSNWKTVASSLCTLHTSGLKIDWSEYHRDFEHSLRLLDLPAYAFDNKNYWIDYRNDWCLTKGDAAIAAPPTSKQPSGLSTTSVHSVVSETFSNGKGSVTIESDITRPDLNAVVMGHVINGVALCPSSLYGDMALTVANYLYTKLKPGVERADMNVGRMEVFKPLLGKPVGSTPQILRVEATTDLSTGRADLHFSSGTGKDKIDHAKCIVEYGDASAWLAEWNRNAYMVRSRIQALEKSSREGGAHKILRGMAYKLFAALVDYATPYRGMEEVIFDSAELETTAKISFQTTEENGKFFCSPFWIDSLAHLSGFTVNANETLDNKNEIYISHGWESMRFTGELSAQKKYRSYVKMQPAGGKMMAGDVYIFEGDTIIGFVGGLKFQCIPTRLLNSVLPNPNAQKLPSKNLVNVPPRAAAVAIAPAPAPVKVQQTKVTTTVASKSGQITVMALDIIAAELGVNVNELADAIEFADIGVDSLMSLSIIARMREALELTLSGSLFLDFPTVEKMKGYFKQFESSTSVDFEPELASGSSSSGTDSGIETPVDDIKATMSMDVEASISATNISAVLRATIAEEMGVEVEEILAAPDLASLGMDSLMTLSILSSLREKTGLSIPSTLLLDNLSIHAIEKSLQVGPAKENAPHVQTVSTHTETTVVQTKKFRPERAATSFLLQGNPRACSKTLFLLPDGGGAAASYAGIPDIDPDLCVFGLNSPFMKTPEEFDCGVSGISEYFVREIQRRQPHGPYILGGWSAGGVVAYESARQLMAAGEVVDRLILIDSPCPLTIEPLPDGLHKWFNSLGLLGDGNPDKIPPWLLPHFQSSITALSTYDAPRMNPAKAPRTLAIWCRDGVCKYPTDPRPNPYPTGHALFLLENKTDFGPMRWDELVGAKNIVTEPMPGNHFTMMLPPNVKLLSDWMRRSVQ